MPEYQITYWRDLPSLVVTRDDDGGGVMKAPLAPRMQGAIDEAAMRLGDVGSDDYLAGWRRGDWTRAEGNVADVAATAVARLESEWSPDAIRAYLDSLGPAQRVAR